jgi:hypothetical protein
MCYKNYAEPDAPPLAKFNKGVVTPIYQNIKNAVDNDLLWAVRGIGDLSMMQIREWLEDNKPLNPDNTMKRIVITVDEYTAQAAINFAIKMIQVLLNHLDITAVIVYEESAIDEQA